MNTQVHPRYTPVFSVEFLRYYGTTMRPYLLFVSGITGLVGLSFIPDLSAAKAILIFSASFLSYGFGQALTDCFQIDTDTLSSPYRPLTQGLISRNQVLAVSVVGLSYCVSVFAVYNPLNLFLGVISGLGLATYTPFKRRWWGGPFYNSWIVALLCCMACLTGEQGFLTLFARPFLWALLTVFFAYANFVLAGYFKDVEADRATSYQTFPVVFGRKAAALVSDSFSFLAVAFALVCFIEAPGPVLSQVVAGAFVLCGVVASSVAQFRLHLVKKDEEAHRSISLVVHSYVFLLSSVAVTRKPAWELPLIAFYALFVLVMKFRPAQHQV